MIRNYEAFKGLEAMVRSLLVGSRSPWMIRDKGRPVLRPQTSEISKSLGGEFEQKPLIVGPFMHDSDKDQ